jgi:hypothetical protein
VAKAKPDDYEAVRTVVATLESFDANDQERILRWAREKLGLADAAPAVISKPDPKPPGNKAEGAARPHGVCMAGNGDGARVGRLG